MGVLGLDAANPGLQHNKVTHAHPYASTTSSASSSSSSVFSLDGVSNQSSISTASTNPADVIWENDGESTVTGRGLMPSSEASVRCLQGFSRESAKVTDAVAPELRKHPRRTNSYVSQSNGTSCPRAPPCLMRQSERKVNFVDNLVGRYPAMEDVAQRLNSPLKILHLRSLKPSGLCRRCPFEAIPPPVAKTSCLSEPSSKKRSAARELVIARCRWRFIT